jgi:hypothetical protein
VSPTTATTYDYQACAIGDLAAIHGGLFKRARATLGGTSFGMNILDLPPNSDELYPEHTHGHDGQEEVYLVLAGSADLILPDCAMPLDPGGALVRVGSGTRRGVRTGPDGARLLVVSGVPGAPYVPAPNSELGGPEAPGAPDAASSLMPGTTQTLTSRHRY